MQFLFNLVGKKNKYFAGAVGSILYRKTSNGANKILKIMIGIAGVIMNTL